MSHIEDPFATPEELDSQSQEKVKDAPKADEGTRTKRAGRSSTMALNGRAVDVQDYPEVSFPNWNETGHRYNDLMGYVPTDDLDISDVQSVNMEILHARRRLFRVQRALSDANRRAAEAKFEYRRKRARVLVGISGGTEKTREAIADVECEEEFGNLMVAEQLADELLNQSRAVKAELDALANLSHNIRAQMSMQ